MARAVIGGLLSSTLITLVIVPVVYSIFEGKLKKEKTLEQERLPLPEEAK
jgi:HAE1 family hydrophobic/amphiphilic exporter-1